eukprot:CAMPEP_0177554390 /NCGR_PEP_ID=MMETSP0369-20130122/67950_1 /TAXON_ID=447022 ORGANISM="Scrippsiella hangoei-like, Strain SHHI-4" /NCGR_SAMPLE_ID=MMETSP0369 /ASSEMBLY_ACC=CAM_ASM_000364 /LENGTH=77 /DNA_ID=CAMNT_0019040395 /DNA_START=29 /DNA_END=259 /DNA_ORIENTATION=+
MRAASVDHDIALAMVGSCCLQRSLIRRGLLVVRVAEVDLLDKRAFGTRRSDFKSSCIEDRVPEQVVPQHTALAQTPQ